jgi:maltooligosyltrehalose synthase
MKEKILLSNNELSFNLKVFGCKKYDFLNVAP